MLTNLLLGFSTMVLCLILQIFLLIAALRYYSHHRFQANKITLISNLFVISAVMLLLLLGNLGQVAIWSLLFIMVGEFDQLSIAFYHSAVNFSSLGYGDIVMSEKHRLLGALEAINGVLMIGVSTAALMTPFKDAITTKLKSQQN